MSAASREPPQLQQLERREHRSEAERVRVEPGEHRRGREHAEDARRPERRPAPLPQRDRREEDGRGDGGGEDERQVPDERRREVVEEAVRGERVRPGVPEVVPDERAVADEERAVEVDGGVAGSGADREHERRDDGGQRSAEQQLAAARKAGDLDEACGGGAHPGICILARTRVSRAAGGTRSTPSGRER